MKAGEGSLASGEQGQGFTTFFEGDWAGKWRASRSRVLTGERGERGEWDSGYMVSRYICIYVPWYMEILRPRMRGVWVCSVRRENDFRSRLTGRGERRVWESITVGLGFGDIGLYMPYRSWFY